MGNGIIFHELPLPVSSKAIIPFFSFCVLYKTELPTLFMVIFHYKFKKTGFPDSILSFGRFYLHDIPSICRMQMSRSLRHHVSPRMHFTNLRLNIFIDSVQFPDQCRRFCMSKLFKGPIHLALIKKTAFLCDPGKCNTPLCHHVQ